MMREIIENRDATHHAAHFAASLDVRIGGEAGSDLGRRQAQVLGNNYRGQHILHVVRSEQRTGEQPERLAVMVHGQMRTRGIGMPGDCLPLGAGFQTIGLDRRGDRYAGQQRADMGGIVAGDETAVSWYKRNKTCKRRAHVVQVAVDIGVVELQRGEDGSAWMVVQEFWAFVKVSTVVL